MCPNEPSEGWSLHFRECRAGSKSDGLPHAACGTEDAIRWVFESVHSTSSPRLPHHEVRLIVPTFAETRQQPRLVRRLLQLEVILQIVRRTGVRHRNRRAIASALHLHLRRLVTLALIHVTVIQAS